jgi:hypothetical protein
MHTHRAKEIEDNTPCKTDEKDAAVIADLATQGKGLKLVENSAQKGAIGRQKTARIPQGLPSVERGPLQRES